MKIIDLLYCINYRIKILDKQNTDLKIYLNEYNFNEILNESKIKYNNIPSNSICIQGYNIYKKFTYPWEHPLSKIGNEFAHAHIEYNFQNYFEERIRILTENERIIKNIIE